MNSTANEVTTANEVISTKQDNYTLTNTTIKLTTLISEDHGSITCISSLRNISEHGMYDINVTVNYWTYGKNILNQII